MKYTITLNEDQMRLIAECLEEHSRMMSGQLDHKYIPAIQKAMRKELSYDKYIHNRESVDLYLREIKKLIWKDLNVNANYGIGYSEESDLCYDMYKEIKHTFEKEEQEECFKKNKKYFSNVHSSEPSLHTKHPRIIIETHTDRELKLKRILDE